MIRRTFALAAAVLVTVSATAAEPVRSRREQPVPQFDLRALFERAPGVDDAVAKNGVTEGPGATEVILARVGPDGKLIKVCVNSEEAVRRFFDAPIETLETKQAREQ